MQVMGGEWFKPERGHRGHYILNLLKSNEILPVHEDQDDPWAVNLNLEVQPIETNDEAILEINDHDCITKCSYKARVTATSCSSSSISPWSS